MAKAKKLGKLNISEMRNLINKKAGMEVAHNLTQDNPTEVKDWIPTGSRWLDSIICRGKLAGVPVGKVVEIAGLEGSGKSYMAAQVAANAQKRGIDVIYFDSESAIDPGFLENAGCSLDNLLYVQAQSVEFVLETIEELLGSNDNRMLARILAKGMSKLTVPIANSQSTFLVLNQLKTNIPQGPAGRIAAMINPYTTPGGKAMHYAYSLRIWLTGRKSKASYISDDRGFRVGSEVKAKLKKSRFGTEGRECTFKIIWGGDVGIQDEESWLEAVKASDNIVQKGAWYDLVYADGTTEKFQAAKWLEKLKQEKFRNRIVHLMDEEIIMRFEKKEGSAEDFYNVDPE